MLKLNKYLGLLIICLVQFGLSCSSDNSSEKKLSEPTTKSDSIKKEEITPIEIHTLTFHPEIFIRKIVQYVSSLKPLKHPFIHSIDTLNSNDSLSYFQRLYLAQEKFTHILHHDFDSGDFFLKLEIDEAEYPDSTTANSAFHKLQNHMNSRSDEKFVMCGTKGNDFFYLSQNKIIWLHGDCPYDETRFRKINSLFKESTYHYSVSDSIKCKCGGKNITHK